ncbi:hypothetical protein [Streptomyces sp. NPDC096013]|uniref:hypothetical protein n=1 Tax=Streptomyces sp. NPDC096013 TaxID=3366069 RepID=UPI003809B834
MSAHHAEVPGMVAEPAESLPGTGPGTVEMLIGAAESAFIRTEVRDVNNPMAALSNWITLA